MPRQKGHTTLSDLLADDVRDYFLREGVPAELPPSSHDPPPPQRRSRGDRHGRKNKRHSKRGGGGSGGSGGSGGGGDNHNGNGNHHHHQQQQQPVHRSASSPLTTTTTAATTPTGTLRAGWASTPTSSRTSSTSSSSPSYRGDDSNTRAMMENNLNKKKKKKEEEEEEGGMRQQQGGYPNNSVQQPQQLQHQQQGQRQTEEQQLRGQHTAERHQSANGSTAFNNSNNHHHNNHNHHHQNTNSNSNININQAKQQHQQQHLRNASSGSNSTFHSQRSSSSSKKQQHILTAADAEFLRRYAEEKERTNLRMSGISGAVYNGGGGGRSPPSTSGGGGNSALSSGGSSIGGGIRSNYFSNASSPSFPFDSNSSIGSIGSSNSNSDNKNKNKNKNNPYHSLLQSPRPPTVTGSHRPGLPSIDNDDWEEDDRIERRDKRREERREARKQQQRSSSSSSRPLRQRRRRRSDSMGGENSVGDRSVGGGGGGGHSLASSPGSQSLIFLHQQQQHHQNGNNNHNQDGEDYYNMMMMNNKNNSNNSNMMANHNHNNMTPMRTMERMTSQGTQESSSTMSSPIGVGITPGSERYESGSSTLCYSTGGSSYNNNYGGNANNNNNHHHHQLRQQLPPEMPNFHNHRQQQHQQQQQHVRGDSTGTRDSIGTFVRRRSSSNGSVSAGPLLLPVGENHGFDGRQQQQQQQQQQNDNNNNNKERKKKRHTRPLSYLSASSDSGKEDTGANNSGGELTNNDSGDDDDDDDDDSRVRGGKEEVMGPSPSPSTNRSYSTRGSGSHNSSLLGLGAIPTPTNNNGIGSSGNNVANTIETMSSRSQSANGSFHYSSGSALPLGHVSSTESSDFHSSLMGSVILDSNAPPGGGGDASRFAMVNNGGNRPGIGVADYHLRQQQDREQIMQRRYEDDESSDGSYDSDESSESSYTSDSYDSASSYTSSERRGRRGGKQQHNLPRHNSIKTYSDRSSDVSWEPVNFHRGGNFGYHRDDVESRGGGGIMMPSNEQERLFGRNNGNSGGPTYSSFETNNRQLRYNKKTNGGYKSSSTGSSASKNHRNRRTNNRRRLGGGGSPGYVPLRLDQAIEVLLEKVNTLFVMLELFISNMPTLVASLALAWSSLGVDWFKWYEETFDACHPTNYHNKACIFSEFPGCFACDTDRDGYQFVLHFHYLCSTIAFILSSFLVGKIMIAFPVVRDELANPTTAAPLGLLCMAFEKVFAGNFGYVGKGITFVACAMHTAVGFWFIFISVVYKTLPEPSWFSNTTGIGLAAAKMYLYWTPGGYFLSGFSVLLFSMFYVVSLYRIHVSEKMSAPVCWVQLSGPAVVLYGFTIFSQPASDEDDFALLIEENKEHFFQVHRRFYMPVIHTFFAFCMVSMVSSLYLVRTKWKSFSEKEFSPAHVSFCAPLVAHVNAMQAYRSSLNKFSSTPPGTPFKLLLYRYWTFGLICGTVLVFFMTWKFFKYLPRWCHIDVEDDEMPPAPDETIVTRLLQKGEARDEMTQNFVSAAVLQANESGALVRVLQDGKMKYVRSRRMPSMGFDPIMNVSELMSERDRLLQHVTYAANPSRDRGGISSFDDTLRNTFHEPDSLRSSSGRRRRMDFLSFDASSMMRGDH